MDHPENEERLVYTAEEVAKLLQTNRAKVYALINKGLLRTTKIGRRKITKEALMSFLALVDGVDVDAIMYQIPDGWILDDLTQRGMFGERAKKNGPTNSDLKRFLSKGPQSQVAAKEESDSEPFAVPLYTNRGGISEKVMDKKPRLISEIERKRIEQRRKRL